MKGLIQTGTKGSPTTSLARPLFAAPILDVTCDLSVRVQAAYAAGGLQKLAALSVVKRVISATC